MNKKGIYLLGLVAIVLMNLFLRYPHTPHQRLFDSTHFHLEAYLLIEDGRAIWNLNPLSIFGLYPIRGAGLMGSVYYLSSASLFTGLAIEPSIFLMNIGIAVFMVLSAFMLGRKLFNNNLIGLLTAFFCSSARIIVVYQDWTATPRGFFAGFLPILIFLMLSSYTKEGDKIQLNKKYLFLFLLMLIFVCTIHRSIGLAIPGFFLFFAYLKYSSNVKKIIGRFRNPIRPNDKIYKIYKIIAISIVFFLSIVLSISMLSNFFGSPEFLEKTIILHSTNPFLQAVNFIYYLSRKFGIPSLFAAIGFVFISSKSKDHMILSLYLAMLALIPFSIQTSYAYPIWAIYLSLFAGFGFYKFITFVDKHHLVTIGVTAIILITMVGAPFFVTISEPHHVDRGRETFVTEQEIETSYAVRHYVEEKESFYVDPMFSSTILSSYSGRCSLGLRGIEQLWINESLKNEYIIESVIQGGHSFENFYREKGQIFYITNDPIIPERDDTRGWRSRGHPNLIPIVFRRDWYYRIVDAYNLRLMVIDIDNIEEQEYVYELDDLEYILYNNGRFTFYTISY